MYKMNIRRAEAKDMASGTEVIVTQSYDILAVVTIMDVVDPYDPHNAFKDASGDSYGLEGTWVLEGLP